MADGSTTAEPDQLHLRAPTFGDWVACGDVRTQCFIANPLAGDGVDATMEFSLDPVSVAAWFARIGDMTGEQIRDLDYQRGKALFHALQIKAPAFSDATASDTHRVTADGIVQPLKTPLPGARAPISEITIRRPKVGDWIKCGDLSVTRVDVEEKRASTSTKTMQQRIDRAAVNRWFMALTGLPEPILHLLAYDDARIIYAHIRGLTAGLDLGN